MTAVNLTSSFLQIGSNQLLKNRQTAKSNRTLTSAEVWSKTPNVERDFRTEMQCISDIKEGVYHVKLNLTMENLSCTFLLLFLCQNYLCISFKGEEWLSSFKVALDPWGGNWEVISPINFKILHYIFLPYIR